MRPGDHVVIFPARFFACEWTGRAGVIEEVCTVGRDVLVRFPGGRLIFFDRSRVEVLP